MKKSSAVDIVRRNAKKINKGEIEKLDFQFHLLVYFQIILCLILVIYLIIY